MAESFRTIGTSTLRVDAIEKVTGRARYVDDLDFPGLFPDVRVLPLEENYRSTQPILDATNRVIAASTERHEKTLWTGRDGGEKPAVVTCHDEDEQSDFIVRRVLELREMGTLLKQQAVLFRATHHSLPLEMELQRRNIPYKKYGGLKFTETAHVKDLTSILRLAENPRDQAAGLRVLTLLPGVGPQTAQRLLEALAESGGDFMAWADLPSPAPAESARATLASRPPPSSRKR